MKTPRLAIFLALFFLTAVISIGFFLHLSRGFLKPSDSTKRAAATEKAPVTPPVQPAPPLPPEFMDLPRANARDSRPSVSPARNVANANAASVDPSGILATRMITSTSDLPVVEEPDGSRSLHLGGRVLHMSALVMGPDGKLVARCFSNYDEITGALAQQPKIPADVER